MIFWRYMYYVRTYEVISGDDGVGRSYKQKQKVTSTNGTGGCFSVFNILAHKIFISGVRKYYQLLYWILAFLTVIAFINRNVTRAQKLSSH